MTTHNATATRTATAVKAGKFSYTMTLPNGKIVVKNDKREFTHVILYQTLETGFWGVHGFAGNADLALKSAGFYASMTSHFATKIVKIEVAS